jgi:excisionase family DNA binding protein
MSDETTTPAIMIVGEAARYSGLHRDRLVAAMNTGELPFVKFGGRRFIEPPRLDAWLASIGLTPMRASR